MYRVQKGDQLTYEEALAAYLSGYEPFTVQDLHCDGHFDGLGFFFPVDTAIALALVGIDLDGCFDADGVMFPWAQIVLERFTAAYCEQTPSGQGFHILCLAEVPDQTYKHQWNLPNQGRKKPGIELYHSNSKRFFTFTGDKIGGDIINCQKNVEWLIDWARLAPPARPASALKRIEAGNHKRPDETEVRALLRRIPPTVPDQEYWEIAQALRNEKFDFSLFHEWASSGRIKYTERKGIKKWNNLASKFSLGTIKHYVKKYSPTGA